MKYLTLIFLIFIISCEPTVKRTIRIKENHEREYGGKVKRIVEYYCDQYLENENPIKIVKKSCVVSSIMEFNEDEIVMKERKWYDFDYPNEPNYIATAKVNESGLVIEEYAKQTGISFEVKRNYSYNQAGFETEKITYRENVFSNRVETIYDEYNCPIKKIYYDENNEIESYYIYEYDNQNMKISSKTYNKDNSITNEWTEKDRNNKSEKDVDIEYYANGKVRTEHYKNGIQLTYDKNERLIERKIYKNDEWQDTYTWKYREDNAVIEESESTSRVVGKSFYKTTTYYRVDSNSNWVEKYIINSEGNVLDLALREIEYY